MRLLENQIAVAETTVLPYSDFKLFSDIGGFKQNSFDPEKINPSDRTNIIARAEGWLDTPYPQVLASDFIRFYRDGNRTALQNTYFGRRHMLYIFALAEAIEHKGRFADRIMDGVMLILDEQDWVLHAHVFIPSNDRSIALSPWYSEHPYIDLFAAETGAILAIVDFVAKDILDSLSPIICERLRYVVKERITDSFLAHDMHWMGFKGYPPNNWNPWILSNILTTVALLEEDLDTRRAVVVRAMKCADNFINGYKSDGGCDEGPSYWSHAGGALFAVLELLYDLTAGAVDIFGEDLIRRMGEYEADFHISGQYFANFADSPPKLTPVYRQIVRYGRRVGSKSLESFGAYMSEKEKRDLTNGYYSLYTKLKCMVEPIPSGVVSEYKTQAFYDGIGVMIEREKSDGSGFYLAFKGGTNGESHNHNDVGNFVVYDSGEPIFVDAGSGVYSKRTFDSHRYEIWAMRSDYHNLPIINGCDQSVGGQYRARDYIYSPENHSLSIDIAGAYAPSVGVTKLVRTMSMNDGVISLRDEIALKSPGKVEFNLLCGEKPIIDGDTVRIGSAIVKLGENLTARLDSDFDMDVEDDSIRKRWGRELFRLLLVADEFTESTFSLTISHAE